MTVLQGCRPPARRLQHSQEVDVDVALMQGMYSSALNICQSDSHAKQRLHAQQHSMTTA